MSNQENVAFRTNPCCNFSISRIDFLRRGQLDKAAPAEKESVWWAELDVSLLATVKALGDIEQIGEWKILAIPLQILPGPD